MSAPIAKERVEYPITLAHTDDHDPRQRLFWRCVT